MSAPTLYRMPMQHPLTSSTAAISRFSGRPTVTPSRKLGELTVGVRILNVSRKIPTSLAPEVERTNSDASCASYGPKGDSRKWKMDQEQCCGKPGADAAYTDDVAHHQREPDTPEYKVSDRQQCCGNKRADKNA
jgi:hypothetical protein